MTEKVIQLVRKDWALLVIAAARGNPLSPVQLQKVLFLLGQEYESAVGSDFYDFVPYDYGPFSIEIYTDTEELEADGLITVRYAAGRKWKEYAATPDGLSQAEELRKGFDAELIGFIDEKVNWARQSSFRALIREVYKQYPAFAVKSVFQKQT